MSGPARVTNLKGDNGFVYKKGAGALAIAAGRRVDTFVAHAASVLNITGTDNGDGDALSSVNLVAGQVWFCNTDAASLVSGEVSAYYAA